MPLQQADELEEEPAQDAAALQARAASEVSAQEQESAPQQDLSVPGNFAHDGQYGRAGNEPVTVRR